MKKLFLLNIFLILLLILVLSINIYADEYANLYYSAGISMTLIRNCDFSGYLEIIFYRHAFIFEFGYGFLIYKGNFFPVTKLFSGFRYYFIKFKGFFLGLGMGFITISIYDAKAELEYNLYSFGYRHRFSKSNIGLFIEGALLIFDISDFSSGIGLYIGLGYSI